MSFSIILIGFCCIYSSITYVIEWYFLYFFLTGVSIAYLTPCLLKLTTEAISPRIKKSYHKHSFTLIVLVWLILSAVLIQILGVYIPKSSWRFLYLITGIINIASSPLVSYL
jgi:MFS family permease